MRGPAGRHRRPTTRRARGWTSRGAVLLVAVLGAALLPPVTAQAAVGVPVTYAGPTYDTSVKRPSENKPQSKLWYTAGAWWGLLVSPTDDRVHIQELMPDNTWRDTGVLVDSRLNATGDAHWDEAEDKLTVASRMDGSNLAVNRFTLTPDRRWVRDAGFPVTVNTGGGSESAAIDRDSTGLYWVTYTRGSRVWVAVSRDTSASSWTAGFQPNVPDVVVKGDDISSVIAFNGRIGVMWSDQQSHAFRMAVHVDGAPMNEWTVEDAMAGTNLADDHINLKTVVDAGGKVYAAVKTSQDGAGPSAPLVGVLIRTPRADGSGSWRFVVAGTVADDHTRPIIQIDKTNQELYFFATAPVSGGDIYYKKTSLANPVFPPGRGQKFVDATPVVNNATGSKQPVTAETGMVILAVAEGKKRYYHAKMDLAGGGTVTDPGDPADTSDPTTPSNLTAQASEDQVTLEWTASTDDSAVADYVVRRGGSVIATPSSTSYVDAAVSAGATYSYTVQARDAAGNTSAESAALTVTVPGSPPPPGSGAFFRSVSTAGTPGAPEISVPVPAHEPGDVLLASIDYRGRSEITAPPGWSLLRADVSGTAMRKATYLRVASAAEPASYTWRFAAAPAAVGSMLAYGGVSATSPVEVADGLVAEKALEVTAPAVPASAGSIVVGLFGVARGTSLLPPPGTVERSDVTSPSGTTYPMTGGTADLTAADAGQVGPLVATSGVSGPNIGHVVVLRSAT